MNGNIVENLGFVVAGNLSSECGYQYPEWVIDTPDILRLTNNGYAKEKDG